ncbi:MAG: hypothetical protein WEE64_14710 [Dehalococcoidia bacterium]
MSRAPRLLAVLFIAALVLLASACSQGDGGPTPAPTGEPVSGSGSGGPVPRDQPPADETGLIDTGGLPAFVFVDQDT